jgi:EAL domain-containing protein (putative c-di-GMP-specific phosphodiesterase class I)
MYQAKQTGGSGWAGYTVDMDQDAIQSARIGAALRHGLLHEEFQLFYQPVVTLPEGRIVGAEALLRWRDPDTGLPVPPDTFIPIAERSGLIVPLGLWVRPLAWRMVAAWRAELGDRAPEYVSDNVSPRQLVEESFVDDVAMALADYGLPASALLVEVTETAVFEGGPALATLEGLRALGVRIALDDFGTGHSSLGLLLSCPVDVLKLDKSFVDDITSNGRQAVIAAGLCNVARGLDLETVAEGVETAAQAERLYELGYEAAQGHHFAKALPVEEVTALMIGQAEALAA